jgi:hypothetical protein
MVKIKVIEKTSQKNNIEGIYNELYNPSMELVRDNLLEKVKHAKCEIHKNESFGTIYINAQKNGSIEFGEFCCEKFKNKLTT